MTSDERIYIAKGFLDAAKRIDEIDNGYLCDDPAASRMLAVNRVVGWQLGRPNDYTFTRLAELIDPKCYLEYSEWIPSGGDECDLEWEWRCSNCDFDLADNYEDLDIKTPKELSLFHCPHCGARILGTRYRKDNDSER